MFQSPIKLMSLAICSIGIFFASTEQSQAQFYYTYYSPSVSYYSPTSYWGGWGWYGSSYTSYYSPSYSCCYSNSCTSCCGSSCGISCGCNPCSSCSTCGYGGSCSCDPCGCSSCGGCGICSSCTSGSCASGACGFAGAVRSDGNPAPTPDNEIPRNKGYDSDRTFRRNNSSNNPPRPGETEEISPYKKPENFEDGKESGDGFNTRTEEEKPSIEAPMPENTDTEIIEDSDDGLDLFNDGVDENTTFKKPTTIKQRKPAPADEKAKVETKKVETNEEKANKEETPGVEKKETRLRRLPVRTVNVDRTITWRARPELKRLSIRSQFKNPVVARTEIPLKKRTNEINSKTHIAQK